MTDRVNCNGTSPFAPPGRSGNVSAVNLIGGPHSTKLCVPRWIVVSENASSTQGRGARLFSTTISPPNSAAGWLNNFKLSHILLIGWALLTFMRRNLSRPDHRQMVCDSKFIGSQTGYRGNKNRLGIVTGLQRDAR